MNKEYKILWIDDEYNELIQFSIDAEHNDIILDGYQSFEEAFEHLETNLYKYDGVILDALFFENSNQVKGTESLAGLVKAKTRLTELRDRKAFPVFILSGQTRFEKDSTFSDIYGIHYRKNNPEDITKLFSDIKQAADLQPDTQIRHEHTKAFEALDNFDSDASKTLMKILKAVKNGGNDFDDKEQFTQIRIVLEMLFRKANEYGFLHDDCIPKGKVNLTESSLFLAGEDTKHIKVKCAKTHFPKLIADAVKDILFITGGASHTTEVDPTQEINIQEYRRKINTPYLLYSLTFRLMDVIIWFNEYSNQNIDIEVNKSYWEEIEYFDQYNKYEFGKITRIASNGWGTVRTDSSAKEISIYKDYVRQLNLEVGDEIKYTIEEKSQAKNIQII